MLHFKASFVLKERLRNKTFVRFLTIFMVGTLILPDFMLCEEKSIWWAKQTRFVYHGA